MEKEENWRAKSREQRARSDEQRKSGGAQNSPLYALGSTLSEGLSCEAFKGFDVSLSGLGNDVLGKSGGRGLLWPVQAVQVVSQELLVKALLRAAGLVGVHGPEP